jgi:hypothetical protein
MKTTLRQLDKALQKIAEAHDLKPDYFWGDWADSFEGRVQRYPAIVCNVKTPVNFGKVTTIQLNIIAVDQVANGEVNLKDVESDTLQMLHDFHKVLKYSPNWNEFCAVQSTSADLKFKDSSPDQVAGWQSTLSIKLIETNGLCDLPLTGYDYNQKINC